LTIKALRILPPFAIGRLGSADEPVDNFTIDIDIRDEADKPLGFRPIKPAPTLVVDRDTGEIRRRHTPASITFKHDGKIRPVAPFLEVFALTEDDTLEPLTTDMLRAETLTPHDVSWRVSVSNRKVERRTGKPDDRVTATTDWITDHDSHTLKGHCANFVSPEAFIDFGRIRFIKPNEDFPQIRLRFTPAKGLIYGPAHPDEKPEPVALDPHAPERFRVPAEQAIYDRTKSWLGFGAEAADGEGDPSSTAFRNETLPASLFAIDPPAPSWLYNNKAVSRGYLDDACDGFVEVKLRRKDGSELVATARICAAPPALVPDSLFVRTLADDFEQIVHGPNVAENEPPAVTLARAQDIVRRAYETVRFMNVVVMNGNDFKGRPALVLDSMPEEEAAGTQRAIRPVMPANTVDTFAIMTLHQQAYAALRAGTAPWFLRLLRKPDEVADYTDHGRRKMPALMCGADNSYLALTWRQIDTIEKAARAGLRPDTIPADVEITPRNATARRSLTNQINYEATGNPISSRPITSVANCCPGLEVDFRAVWRRMFRGIVLREYDNLVCDYDHDGDDVVISGNQKKMALEDFVGRRLIRILPPGDDEGIAVTTPIIGPASSDIGGAIRLTTETNPYGLAPLEWSNALARIVANYQGQRVRCAFSDVSREQHQPWVKDAPDNLICEFEVRHFFEPDTAVIAKALADAGELTQGLCSPWQNDYRECSCYYWASARPDYVNIEPGENGLSTGHNWMTLNHTGTYVADDYADRRLIMYDDLFRDWEILLKFQVGGRDVPDEPAGDS
jgi:hypothetical protein